MNNKYRIGNGVIVSGTGSTRYLVPSLGSQSHKITDPRDLEEAVWLMNYAYEKGRIDKAAAIMTELQE